MNQPTTAAQSPVAHDREKVELAMRERNEAQRHFSTAATTFVQEVSALGILNDKATEYFALIRGMARISCEWQLQEARMKLYGGEPQDNFWHANMIELALEGAGMARAKVSTHAERIAQDAHSLLLDRYVELEERTNSALLHAEKADEVTNTTRSRFTMRLEQQG